jgi:hypothetical protein
MIDALINDMSFKLIEREYVKRVKKRGKDTLAEQEYRLYLEALVKRIQEVISPNAGNSPIEANRTSVGKTNEGNPKGSGIIEEIGNPEAKANMEFIRQECEKNKGKNGFSLFLEDGWVGVSDIQIWLKDMGLPFEVSGMDAPSSTLNMGSAMNAALGSEGEAGIGNSRNAWKVNFVRV